MRIKAELVFNDYFKSQLLSRHVAQVLRIRRHVYRRLEKGKSCDDVFNEIKKQYITEDSLISYILNSAIDLMTPYSLKFIEYQNKLHNQNIDKLPLWYKAEYKFFSNKKQQKNQKQPLIPFNPKNEHIKISYIPGEQKFLTSLHLISKSKKEKKWLVNVELKFPNRYSPYLKDYFNINYKPVDAELIWENNKFYLLVRLKTIKILNYLNNRQPEFNICNSLILVAGQPKFVRLTALTLLTTTQLICMPAFCQEESSIFQVVSCALENTKSQVTEKMSSPFSRLASYSRIADKLLRIKSPLQSFNTKKLPPISLNTGGQNYSPTKVQPKLNVKHPFPIKVAKKLAPTKTYTRPLNINPVKNVTQPLKLAKVEKLVEPGTSPLNLSPINDHNVQKGDTLYGLARKYYNDEKKWKEIYELNKSSIKNPNLILVGQKLKFPAKTEPLETVTPFSQPQQEEAKTEQSLYVKNKIKAAFPHNAKQLERTIVKFSKNVTDNLSKHLINTGTGKLTSSGTSKLEVKDLPNPKVLPIPALTIKPPIKTENLEIPSVPSNVSTETPKEPEKIEPNVGNAYMRSNQEIPVIKPSIEPQNIETVAETPTEPKETKQETSIIEQQTIEPKNIEKLEPPKITSETKPKTKDGFFYVVLADGIVNTRATTGNEEGIKTNENWRDNEILPGVNVEGRFAFYAKGTLLDKFLLTSSFDSDRQFQPKFLQATEPNRLYPIYGDSSSLLKDAQASGKLFLRLEGLNNPDEYGYINKSNFLLGDFNTELRGKGSVFGAYNRSLYGIRTYLATSNKSQEDPNLSLILTAAPAMSVPVRDEIRSTGLSFYYLSINSLRHLVQNSNSKNPAIVEGSEKVQVVVKDKNQPDRILNSEYKQRDLDYNIDPFFGTINFKTPVSNFDSQGNPVWVIINYEYTNDPFKKLDWDSFKSNVIGGRAETNFLEKKVNVGVNYVKETGAPNDYQLISADAVIRPLDKISITGEFSYSQTNSVTGDVPNALTALSSNPGNGSISWDGGLSWIDTAPVTDTLRSGLAYRAELEANPFDWTKLRLFYREGSKDFTNLFGSVEPGLRRFGGGFEQQLSDYFVLMGDYIQTDPLYQTPTTDIATTTGTSNFGSTILASVGLRWQNIELNKQKLNNSAGGDISVSQNQSAGTMVINEKDTVTGGAPAIGQESATDVVSKPFNESGSLEQITSTGGGSTQPQGTANIAKAGQMSAELRAEDMISGSLTTYRGRGSFNFTPIDRLTGNFRSGLNHTTLLDKAELSGDIGLGAEWGITDKFSVFARNDWNNIGGALIGMNQTFSVGFNFLPVDNKENRLKTYAQYGLTSSISGRTNLIATGLNNRWKITDWLTNDTNLELSWNVNEIFKGTSNNISNAQNGSVAFEFLPVETLKSAIRYELRRQVGAIGAMSSSLVSATNPYTPTSVSGQLAGGTTSSSGITTDTSNENYQQVLTLSADGKVGDLSVFSRYIWNRAWDPISMRASDVNLILGTAFRPIESDQLNFIAKYEFRNSTMLLPTNLAQVVQDKPITTNMQSSIVSVEGIWQMAPNFEFSQKYAIKLAHETVTNPDIPSPVVPTDLIISRLTYKPFYFDNWLDHIDTAIEYRIMRQTLTGIANNKSGFVTEIGYRPAEFVRIGVGYNFADFDDFWTQSNNYNGQNWFLRVTGKY